LNINQLLVVIALSGALISPTYALTQPGPKFVKKNKEYIYHFAEGQVRGTAVYYDPRNNYWVKLENVTGVLGGKPVMWVNINRAIAICVVGQGCE